MVRSKAIPTVHQSVELNVDFVLDQQVVLQAVWRCSLFFVEENHLVDESLWFHFSVVSVTLK